MFKISGTGCCLLDLIYARVNFSSPVFLKYRSRAAGDGGIEPGKLSFTEDFERFAGQDCVSALKELTLDTPADATNIGGPGVVSLIHVAQILDPAKFRIRFTASIGQDETGEVLKRLIGETPLLPDHMLIKPGRTPFTYVLSDPEHGGSGERAFLNNRGTAEEMLPEDLDDDFFEADIVVFGGTALVPHIHDNLGTLLARAKKKSALTVVTTVYDFRSELRNPTGRWTLGAGDDSYRYIDLLITDREEALRLSGCPTLDQASNFFLAQGVGAAVITNGSMDILVSSSSALFSQTGRFRLPASQAVIRELAEHPGRKGDTTGCGDNFAGGMIASVATQMESGAGAIDLAEAVAWGAASGGFACFYVGGVFHETRPGHKRVLIEPYVRAYFQDRESGNGNA